MTVEQGIEYMLSDCFFALGQAAGSGTRIEHDAIVWLQDRYREKFLHAVVELGNSWDDDRDRVMTVGRWLGRRAAFHAGCTSIDVISAARAAAEIEAGCQMSRQRGQAAAPDAAHNTRPQGQQHGGEV
jgi:hypothetical protein